MRKILIITMTMILVLSACNAVNTEGQQNASPVQGDVTTRYEDDAALFAELYPVSQENPFIFASYEEVTDLLEIGTGILVFGFPDCPRCQNAFPVLEQAFYEKNLQERAGYRGKILYYDIFDDRAEGNERYQTLVSRLEEYLQTDDDGNPRIFVPDVFFLASGDIVGNHMDTVSSQENPGDRLTEQQAAELLDIYKDLITEMENRCC